MVTLALTSSATSLAVLLAKATLLLLIAFGAASLLQRAAAGARHLVWLAILGGILLLPALSAWAPLRLAVLPAAMAVAPAPVSAANDASTRLPTAQLPSSPADLPAFRASAAEENSGASPRTSLAALDGWRIAVIAYAGTALALLAWLAFGFVSVRRIVRRATPLEERSWTGPLYEIADRLGIDRTPRIVRSTDVKMPFAAGLLHPCIVLPAECDAWNDERRSAVLMHELAHIRRRDLMGHTLGRVTCALYWFHPLVWSATRRMRIESERACDDLALTCGLRATSYAEHLLDIVSSIRDPRTPAVAIPMADRREFEGRMLAILDPALRRRQGRMQSLSLVGGLSLLAVVVGAAAPAPRATPAAAPAASAAASFAPLVALPGADTILSEEALTPQSAREREDAETRRTSLRMRERARLSQRTDEVRDEVRNKVREEMRVERPAPVAAPAPRAAPSRSGSGSLLLDTLETRDGAQRATLLTQVLRADTSASLRRVAAWGLQDYAERADVSDALASTLRRDRSAVVREMAAWALANGNESRGVLGALAEAMRKDEDERVRETAAWAIGNLDASSVSGELAAALADPSAGTRTMALWALGTSDEGKAPAAVLEALRDPEVRVRRLAAWTLYNLQDPASLPALESALARERDPSLRVAYIRAMGAIGGESAGALARLLDSGDATLRAAVVDALAGRGGSSWPMPMPRPRPYP